MESTNVQLNLSQLPEIGGTSFNQKTAVVWLEQQPQDLQLSLVEHVFKELLIVAAQPKQFSGSACSKLCGFVENCSKSSSPELKGFAFAEETSMKLFNYFIDWNEQDSHRSMRLVLDYLVSAIIWNPDAKIGKSIKNRILNDTISVITLQATKPSTKSSMIAIDHLIQKNVVYLSEVLDVYERLQGSSYDQGAAWDSFISRVFAWMELQYVWTVAGKLLVTILTQPWYQDDKLSRHHPSTWHKFFASGLDNNLDLLEPVKVYVFMPLFRTDPASTLVYLHELTSLQKLTSTDTGGWDLNAMIWVAMLEAGKKTGVVGEPDHDPTQNIGVTGQLPVHILEVLLCHQSHEARASGLSILVASPSTTKPYTSETLNLLKKHLPSFYEDVDPKIRYDVLGHSRNLIRRLHNSIDTLRKESTRASKKEKTAPTSEGTDSTLKDGDITQSEKQQIAKINGVRSPTMSLWEHESFIRWYAQFLKDELAPTASYQRHITSLKAMSYFLKSSLSQSNVTSIMRWPLNLLVDNTWFRAVLDLIMDPYDDVRETASSLVMLLQPGKAMSGPPALISGLLSPPIEELRIFCQKANDLALKTARADHCDGAARSQELLCRWSSNFEEAANVLETILSNLEQKLCAAEKDLASAVLQAPVHGDFASLGYIWNSLTGAQLSPEHLVTLNGFQDRAISCCRRVWEAVRHILCDDSPEGHLPEELQQVEGLDTKDLLSYSFRAVHESSNLLRTIAQNARHDRGKGLVTPSRRNFEEIGTLTFDELSNLRHRGAFSTVSQTFTACCQLVQCIPTDPNHDVNLLEEWYRGALNCIYTQGSTTRRSAGIPAIIVGILASKADSPSFEDVIIKLQEIGRQPAFTSETDGSNLAQVHALNCLKDIFKTSFLSHRAEPYLTDCLQLAATSLQSEVWAIRNCGLILLRSLIDNLFGTSESKHAMEAGWDGRTVRIPYHKYKALPLLLVNLLELGKQSYGMVLGTQTAEAVFPALDIIRRAGPPEGYHEKLYDIISWYLGSRIWHVREIAARTLCSLLLTSTWLQSIEKLIGNSGDSSNKLHGALLTIKFLLERLIQVMPDQLSEGNTNALCALLNDLSVSSHCLHTCTEAQAVYLDIQNFMEKTFKTRTNGSILGSGKLMAQQDVTQVPLALLNIRKGETVVQRASRITSGGGSDILNQELKTALATDINVACAMLEAISFSDLAQTGMAPSGLANIYLDVCFTTSATEPRTVALEGLASLMDKLLSHTPDDSTLSALPTEETLFALWSDIHQKPINPALSDAIIRVSGPLLATSLIRARGQVDENLARRLSSWGTMMSDAGVSDRTFDTRIASVEAINSLTISIRALMDGPENSNSPLHAAHLSWLVALYDALTDDDVEVREAAAEAASPVLGLALVPVEAGVRLLRWLAENFGQVPDFVSHVTGRMVGNNFGSSSFVAKEGGGLNWISAETQLQEAMRFDDSLFVVEEHNQYIDEVREAKRWRDVYLSSSTDGATNKALAEWTLAGLRTLLRITQTEQGDGPLGWTSKPQVFAICARVLVCAFGVVKRGKELGEDGGLFRDVAEEMKRFWNMGRRSGQAMIHGLLLDLCWVEFEG